MYDDIKNMIQQKRPSIDQETLTYLTNYFYVLNKKEILPNSISLESIIDKTLSYVEKIVFYDENDDIYKELGPDVKGTCKHELKTLFVRKDLEDPLQEMIVYHEIHHAAQTNEENQEVGINQVGNIGRFIMEAQTQWFAEEVYKEIHHVDFPERKIPSEQLRMQEGGTIVSSLHNYELFDCILSKLSIILDVPKEYFVRINFLYEDGLKKLEKLYQEKSLEKNIKLSFKSLLYYLDYIYCTDYLSYKEGFYKDIILTGGETAVPVVIHPDVAPEKVSQEKQMRYIRSLDESFLAPLLEGDYDLREFSKYIIDNKTRKMLEDSFDYLGGQK